VKEVALGKVIHREKLAHCSSGALGDFTGVFFGRAAKM
jgi:hypothetical protein